MKNLRYLRTLNKLTGNRCIARIWLNNGNCISWLKKHALEKPTIAMFVATAKYNKCVNAFTDIDTLVETIRKYGGVDYKTTFSGNGVIH